MSVRERITPLVLAVVEYPDGGQTSGSQTSHPNGAHRLLGLAFGAAEAGPAAEAAAGKLVLSGFDYRPQTAFEEMFGKCDGPLIAIRFQVASRDETAAVLRKHRVPFLTSDAVMTVPPHGVLGCGVEFVESGRP